MEARAYGDVLRAVGEAPGARECPHASAEYGAVNQLAADAHAPVPPRCEALLPVGGRSAPRHRD